MHRGHSGSRLVSLSCLVQGWRCIPNVVSCGRRKCKGSLGHLKLGLGQQQHPCRKGTSEQCGQTSTVAETDRETAIGTGTGGGSRKLENMMNVTNSHGGGARAAAEVRTATTDTESQGRGTTQKTEIVAIDQNELGIGVKIPETDAIDTENASEGAQILTAMTQGALGRNHHVHHYHIEFVPLSRQLASIVEVYMIVVSQS